MRGLFLNHRTFEMGKVVELSQETRRFSVVFFKTGEKKSFTSQVLNDFTRYTLPIGAQVKFGPEELTVLEFIKPEQTENQSPTPYKYKLKFNKSGMTTIQPENLFSLINLPSNDLKSRIINLQMDEFKRYKTKLNLSQQIKRLSKECDDIRSLLSPRIDLHPHQAYVASNVINDPIRRYILADEVGLGKTIEAGIIVHDCLQKKHSAKILIITPASLSRQWFFEMFSSFGGQTFKLCELHDVNELDFKNWTKLIMSYENALDTKDEILKIKWDLVIVDEVHQILKIKNLNNFIKKISLKTRDILLLSAIPLKQRETELLELLSILEPSKFAENFDEKTFLEMFKSQPKIGSRLRILKKELEKPNNNQRILKICQSIMEIEIIKKDQEMMSNFNIIIESKFDLENFKKFYSEIIHKYRISRRILRNRREVLIEKEKITPIKRLLNVYDYEPEAIEEEIYFQVKNIFVQLRNKNIPKNILFPFLKLFLQALSHPHNLKKLLDIFKSSIPASPIEDVIELMNVNFGTYGKYWEKNVIKLFNYIKYFNIDQNLFENLSSEVSFMLSDQGENNRTKKLYSILDEKIKSKQKTLIFAGFPDLAEQLVDELSKKYGRNIITSFLNEDVSEIKEENVSKFRDNPEVVILVSDETGGEGRNFQFVQNIIHFDLPLNVSSIEQRIGRLDRLKREEYFENVESNVFVNSFSSKEKALFKCYEKGFNVFTESISGLEFAINEIEERILYTYLYNSEEDLDELHLEINETIKNERMSDSSEALLDEASFDKSIDDYLYKRQTDIEIELEKEFVEYFKLISTGRSCWPNDGCWVFRPENVVYGTLNLIDKNIAGEVSTKKGTFNRNIAQKKRDIEFFTFGNPLFDAVVTSLDNPIFGSTFAIKIKKENNEEICFFKIVYKVKIEDDLYYNFPSLVNTIESFFDELEYVEIFDVSSEINLLDNEEKLKDLNYEKENFERDLSKDEVDNLLINLQGDYADIINNIFKNKTEEIKKIFSKKIEEKILNEKLKIEKNCKFLRDFFGNIYDDEIKTWTEFSKNLSKWQTTIKSFGLITTKIS